MAKRLTSNEKPFTKKDTTEMSEAGLLVAEPGSLVALGISVL